MAQRQCAELFALVDKKCIGADNKRLRSQLDQGRERRAEVAFGACVQYMKLQAEGASSRLHNSRLSFGIGIARIAEQGHDARCRDQLAQQFQPLRSDVDVQQSDAREVSSRSVQAGDKSGYDWIGGGAKDDWYGRGRSLGHWRRRKPAWQRPMWPANCSHSVTRSNRCQRLTPSRSVKAIRTTSGTPTQSRKPYNVPRHFAFR